MTYKKRFSLTFILFFVVFGVLKLQAQTILIDPGHGGKDDGAKAFQAFVNKKGKLEKKTHFEKDLVLEL